MSEMGELAELLFGVGVFVLCFLVIAYAGTKMGEMLDNISLPEYHEYRCENNISDFCRYNIITKAGTQLLDCRSGNEYVCQTVIKIEDPQ